MQVEYDDESVKIWLVLPQKNCRMFISIITSLACFSHSGMTKSWSEAGLTSEKVQEFSCVYSTDQSPRL
jgi:hypothetical protein